MAHGRALAARGGGGGGGSGGALFHAWRGARRRVWCVAAVQGAGKYSVDIAWMHNRSQVEEMLTYGGNGRMGAPVLQSGPPLPC